MLQAGTFYTLKIDDILPYGVYLSDELGNRVLLPNAHVPADATQGQQLKVFIYHDADSELVATTSHPKAKLGEIALLRAVATKPVGTFLDWGIEKDLFVPRKEQESPMQEGKNYLVYIYLDKVTGRVVASSRLHYFLAETADNFEEKQPVKLQIYARTPMGYKAVINGTHLGLLFKDEAFKPLYIGQKLDGFIKHIRDDGRMDLCLQFNDQSARDSLTEQILQHLRQNNGISNITDKADADVIYQTFNVSKNAYKKALGQLYKQRKIQLSKSEITLTEN
ncbi:CvfB family protein [Neptunicella marina]|uniref:GntR family transcriptional regulator n=1 Tax=Neptunicella marina TaxID=2125989 RepID=A0A8J6LV75_9ALTE|nr:S1-like domain-containing RNA-binding protein [Neptunicella marina]MBC3764394.1 GntR family transcriptional regulator [Neptunicella marina]